MHLFLRPRHADGIPGHHCLLTINMIKATNNQILTQLCLFFIHAFQMSRPVAELPQLRCPASTLYCFMASCCVQLCGTFVLLCYLDHEPCAHTSHTARKQVRLLPRHLFSLKHNSVFCKNTAIQSCHFVCAFSLTDHILPVGRTKKHISSPSFSPVFPD